MKQNDGDVTEAGKYKYAESILQTIAIKTSKTQWKDKAFYKT
jgi:hypothetical protein